MNNSLCDKNCYKTRSFTECDPVNDCVALLKENRCNKSMKNLLSFICRCKNNNPLEHSAITHDNDELINVYWDKSSFDDCELSTPSEYAIGSFRSRSSLKASESHLKQNKPGRNSKTTVIDNKKSIPHCPLNDNSLQRKIRWKRMNGVTSLPIMLRDAYFESDRCLFDTEDTDECTSISSQSVRTFHSTETPKVANLSSIQTTNSFSHNYEDSTFRMEVVEYAPHDQLGIHKKSNIETECESYYGFQILHSNPILSSSNSEIIEVTCSSREFNTDLNSEDDNFSIDDSIGDFLPKIHPHVGENHLDKIYEQDADPIDTHHLSENKQLKDQNIFRNSQRPPRPTTSSSMKSRKELLDFPPTSVFSRLGRSSNTSQYASHQKSIKSSSPLFEPYEDENMSTIGRIRMSKSYHRNKIGNHQCRSQSKFQSKSHSSSSRRLAHTNTDDSKYLELERHLHSINRMATEHLYFGEYEEALDIFQEILKGQRERYKHCLNDNMDEGFQSDGEHTKSNRINPIHARVGTALHNVAIAYLQMGDYKNAIEVGKEALHVRKHALGHDHAEVGVSLAQLGISYLECGMLLAALEVFNESLRIRKSCYGEKHPKVAKVLNNIGCVFFELNRLEPAKSYFENALKIQRIMLRSNPQAEKVLLSIATTLNNIASIHLQWDELDKSIISLEEALLIKQSVLGDDHVTVLETINTIKRLEIDKNRSQQRKEREMARRIEVKNVRGDKSKPVGQKSKNQTGKLIQVYPIDALSNQKNPHSTDEYSAHLIMSRFCDSVKSKNLQWI